MNDEQLYTKQIEREAASANAGVEKFLDNEANNRKTCNGSNTYFGRHIKENILEDVIGNIRRMTAQVVGVDASEVSRILKNTIKALPDGTCASFWDETDAAFLGLQLTLDTALNPNKTTHTVQSRYGGDKRLLEKKTLPQLERHIGDTVHKQMVLHFIKAVFPAWFRKASLKAEKPTEGGMKATTAYWEENLFRSIRRFSEYLHEKGEHDLASFIDERNVWSGHERQVIGSLIVRAVLNALSDIIEVKQGSRNGKRSLEVVLTEKGHQMEQEIRDYVSQYCANLLPMLVEPVPVTNDNLGGWLSDVLQEPASSNRGSIYLSDKHLEFINRQARVPFQINPFTARLLNELIEAELPLGKFHYQRIQQLPTIAQQLGYAHLDIEEQNIAIANDPKAKELRHAQEAIYSKNKRIVRDGLISYQLKDKVEKLLADEQFFMPISFDFRGRIYSRVPFISFQSNDCGRYLIRFAEKTPIDNRTEHWLKVGISNAGGNDKLSWDKRIHWFDKNRDAIINVGRMVDGGDFTRAYEFLTQDHIDDPFCLAALANEYVKVFVDKSQAYTQCFVCVDASCSGTSIFNAWRQNLHGAMMTNVVDTPEPADIYIEVWNEIKRIAPERTFRASHIKRLEQYKLIRNMMKDGYVPAQYASPKQEQHKRLVAFNNTTLKKANMAFKEKEMEALKELWVLALDEVSSISTVVDWFQAQTREALKHQDTIRYVSSNGSVMTLKYPQSTFETVRVLGYGSTRYRRSKEVKFTDKVDKRRLLNSVTANITHCTDAAALCEAVWDYERPFVAIHDAAGTSPGRHLDDLVARLKEGFATTTQYNVWDAFREANKLDKSPTNAPPVIGDLTDWEQVKKSNYLYS